METFCPFVDFSYFPHINTKSLNQGISKDPSSQIVPKYSSMLVGYLSKLSASLIHHKLTQIWQQESYGQKLMRWESLMEKYKFGQRTLPSCQPTTITLFHINQNNQQICHMHRFCFGKSCLKMNVKFCSASNRWRQNVKKILNICIFN